MKHCPTCNCGQREQVVINVNAPFYELVLLIDQITYGRRSR